MDHIGPEKFEETKRFRRKVLGRGVWGRKS